MDIQGIKRAVISYKVLSYDVACFQYNIAVTNVFVLHTCNSKGCLALSPPLHVQARECLMLSKTSKGLSHTV